MKLSTWYSKRVECGLYNDRINEESTEMHDGNDQPRAFVDRTGARRAVTFVRGGDARSFQIGDVITPHLTGVQFVSASGERRFRYLDLSDMVRAGDLETVPVEQLQRWLDASAV